MDQTSARRDFSEWLPALRQSSGHMAQESSRRLGTWQRQQARRGTRGTAHKSRARISDQVGNAVRSENLPEREWSRKSGARTGRPSHKAPRDQTAARNSPHRGSICGCGTVSAAHRHRPLAWAGHGLQILVFPAVSEVAADRHKDHRNRIRRAFCAGGHAPFD